MKKIFIVFVCLFAVYSCRSQELYIVIDTRDTINIRYDVGTYKNPKYIKNGCDIDYFIRKDDPTEDYGGGILLRYSPYSDSILAKWDIKKLRTINIPREKWIKLKKQPNSKVVNGIKWVHSTPWDNLYKEMYQYYYKRGGMYIVDKRFETTDSIQIRGVRALDVRAQYCPEE